MTIAKVADRGSSAGTTAGTAATAVDMAAAGAITVGNYLIAHVMLNNAGTAGAALTLTVDDARNGSWTVLGPSNRTAGGAANDGATAFICYVKVATAYVNGDDVTFHFSPNSTGMAVVIDEWSGIHAWTPVFVTAVGATGGSGVPSVSITPASQEVLVYGCLAIEGGGTDTYTEDADTTAGSWAALTAIDSGAATASGVKVAGGYKITTDAGAQTWNPTITSRDWAQLIVVFGAAPTVYPDNAEYRGIGWAKSAQGSDTANSTTYVSGSFAATFLSLILIGVVYGNDGQTPSALTSIAGTPISGATSKASVAFNTVATPRSRIELWKAIGTGSAGTVTFTVPEAANGLQYFIVEVGGIPDRNRGDSGILSVGFGLGNSGSSYTETGGFTNPAQDGGTRQIVFSAHDSAQGINPQAFWTELVELALATPTMTFEVQSVNGQGAVAATPASGTGDWGLVSAEIAASIIDQRKVRARRERIMSDAVHRASRW